jgi:phosphate transport system substrate-binding protein
MKKLCSITAIAAAIALGAGVAHARDQIRIVGSSTVFPFSSYVAEELGATTKCATPVVESTGSGGGFKLFCSGVGASTPDITNASRPMKSSEFDLCQENGVKAITQAKIGFDGIAIAQSVDAQPLDLTREQLMLAVAEEVPKDGKLVKNPYKKWNEIDSSLPDREIIIYGPPTTSGTRDAFEELVMEHASKKIEGYGKEKYTKVRQDGAYVPSGENDNLIVQKLEKNKAAFGIFGYSFLAENADKIQGASIEGVKPSPDTVSSGEYPISRSLFFYTKNAHFAEVPCMKDYVELFMSEKMIGDDGPLSEIGLIPLPADEREKQRQSVVGRAELKKDDLK